MESYRSGNTFNKSKIHESCRGRRTRCTRFCSSPSPLRSRVPMARRTWRSSPNTVLDFSPVYLDRTPTTAFVELAMAIALCRTTHGCLDLANSFKVQTFDSSDVPSTVTTTFRVQLNAASLKPVRPTVAFVASNAFPRSIERGLIEAMSGGKRHVVAPSTGAWYVVVS